MPATALMGYAVPTSGSLSGTWGDTLNTDVMGFLDLNFAGLLTLSLSSSAVALTAAQARCQMIRCTGTLLANITIAPDTAVLWYGIRCIENVTSGSFSITLSNAGTVVIPQGRRALVFIDSTNGPRIIGMAGTTSADVLPTGTAMTFFQAAAPSGWTQNVTYNDYAMRIVNSTGAGTGGSVAFSTLFARTATDSYTLLTADIPSHTHSTSVPALTGAVGGSGGQGVPFNNSTAYTSTATGGGGGHSHGLDMRLKYLDMVLAARA